MRLIKSFGFLLFLTISTNSLADNKAPFNSIQKLFAAMSAFDSVAMKQIVTDDFQLLEVGEIWDIDMLASAIQPNGSTYQRRNYFELVKLDISNKTAWVSYWNKATYKVEGKPDNTVAWLESAVLKNVNGQWKIQMLHFTRLELDAVPSTVNFVEYVE